MEKEKMDRWHKDLKRQTNKKLQKADSVKGYLAGLSFSALRKPLR